MQLSEHSSKKKFFYGKVLLLIIIITIINYFDRSAIAFAIIPIERDLILSDKEYGFIASAFGIGYFVAVFFSGILVDRWGAIRVWGLCAILWSLVTVFMGWSRGFWSLFYLRILLGIAESIHFPALLRIIVDLLPQPWHARCISIGLLGIPIASFIGSPFLSFLVHRYSWRTMFFVIGILGLVWALVWIGVFWSMHKSHLEQRESSLASVETPIKPRPKLPWKEMFASKIFLGNCINYFIFGYIVFFAVMWLPGYFQKTFDVNIFVTGFLLLCPWGMSALFILLGGWVSDALWKKTKSIRISRLYPIGIGMFISGLFFFHAAKGHNLIVDILLMSMGLGFAFSTNAPIYSLNIDLFQKYAGTAQGIISGFFGFSGIIAPTVTGWLVQKTGNFQIAIFVVCALSILSFCISLFLQFDADQKVRKI